MILGNFRLFALGAALAGLAAPSLAAAPQDPAATMPADAAPAKSAGRSRRVELPFPLELRARDRAPRPPAPREDAAPHPFRENPLKRTAFGGADSGVRAAQTRRLSRYPEFS